jgi:hypothetical protein
MDDDLWDPQDHDGLRRRIEQGTIEEMGRIFPASYGGVRLEAHNVHLGGKDHYSLAEQRKAWMANRSLTRPLKADFTLTDEKTGEQLDERKGVTLMRVPYYTSRGTFIYNGTNYSAASQSRMIPGAYTRRQNNGGLESQFNVRAGTGRVFRVALEPESGQFRMRIAGSDFHLYSLLKELGVSDEELAEHWGPAVLEENRKKIDSRVLDRAFNKFVPSYRQAEAPSKAEAIVEAIRKAQVSKRVVARTLAGYWPNRPVEKTAGSELRSMMFEMLKRAETKPTFSAGFDLRDSLGDVDDEGDEYQPVGLEGIIAASKKLLAVNRGLDETDERNTPAFSKIYTMDKLMRERIRLDEGKLRRSLLRMIASRRNLSPLHHRAFDRYYLEVITKNPLTTPIEETNPLQLMGQQRRVTQMGPGGIGSSDAITPEMQAVQPSEFGFYSPLEGPECFDAQSQVLTAAGWVAWPHLTGEEFLACMVGGRREFHRPSRLVVEDYEGEMILALGRGIRMCVTPNHRVVLRPSEDCLLRMQAAQQVEGTEIEIPVNPLRTGQDHVTIGAGEWKRLTYVGKVYCATVPGGCLYVRGNSWTSGYWTGNSERAGVDVRLAWGTRIGKDGRIRRQLRNLRTGELEWKSPEEVYDSFVKFPD